LDELIRAAERAVTERDERIRRNIGEARRFGRSTGGSLLAAAGFALLLSRLLPNSHRRTGTMPLRDSPVLGGIALVLPLARVLLPAIEQGLAGRSVRRKSRPPGLPAVVCSGTIDPDRFRGSWYEIARLPTANEVRSAREAVTTCVTTFVPIPGRRCLSVSRQYRLPDGRVRTQRGEAYVVEGSGNAHLRMSLLSPVLRCLPGTWCDYWILMTDDAYQYALAGTPDRRNLWLLSRTPSLAAADEERLVDHARRKQFRTDTLLRTWP
jgi:apolipoprotein D and lipocalin family protein